MQTWTVMGMILGTVVLAGCREAETSSAGSVSQTKFSNIDGGPAAAVPIPQDPIPAGSGIDAVGSSEESHVLLEIGDQAPEISVARWVRGKPAAVLSPGNIHVVEFWETTCRPCLDNIPHMSALQAEYGERVTVVGITSENELAVVEFMEQHAEPGNQKWSEIVNYAIGIDQQEQTQAAYMQASEQDGIPIAFIIGRSGVIEWIGHSKDIDVPLKEIVEGTWDSAKAMETAAILRGAKKAKLELGPEIRAAIDAGEYQLAAELIDPLVRRFPDDMDLAVFRLQCLIRGGLLTEANATAAKMISAAHDNAAQLDRVAWVMATVSQLPGIDLDLALSAARRAAELTHEENASVFETMARVQFRKGNVEDAIELQKKALGLIPDARQSGRQKVALEEYERALTAGPESAVNTNPDTRVAPGTDD